MEAVNRKLIRPSLNEIKEQIADGQTLRIVRVLGMYKSKLTTKKSLEAV